MFKGFTVSVIWAAGLAHDFLAFNQLDSDAPAPPQLVAASAVAGSGVSDDA